MLLLVGHGYAGIQKFNTLMNIPKRVTVKTITKKFKNDRCCKCCRYYCLGVTSYSYCHAERHCDVFV